MKKFLLFLSAVAAMPFVWAVCVSLPESLAGLEMPDDAFLSNEAWGLVAGMLVFAVAWFVFPAPTRVYVFGHEATHALVGALFGAKASNMRVSAKGGSVTLDKSNVWITLAPYVIPFYTVIVALAAVVVRFFTNPLPWAWAWTAATGFTWMFHVFFTLQSLRQTQPDVEEYGKLFSWMLIFVLNVLEILAYIALSANIPLADVMRPIACNTIDAYSATCEAFRHLGSLIP